MDHLVCVIHPFVVNQDVAVYKNGECIKQVECPLTELKDKMYALCKEYNIHDISLGGNQLYGLKLRDDFAATKYSKDYPITVSFF